MHTKIHSKLHEWQLKAARVLIRADLNVPIDNSGTILDDFRLQATLPTLALLQKQQCLVTIITHMGDTKMPADQRPSTRPLIAWFEKQKIPVRYAATIEEAREQKQPGITLLENLRSWPGESAGNIDFARLLALLGDFFVQDAFGTLHRHDASIELVPRFFDNDHRTIGLCIERELLFFDQLLQHPEHPFVLIIGGNKIADKLTIAHALLPRVDTILMAPALSFMVMSAQNMSVGNSLVDPSALTVTEKLIRDAQPHQLHIPVDYLVQSATQKKLSIIPATAFTADDVGIAPGPRTTTDWISVIKHAKTVLLNGMFGFKDQPETVQSMNALINAMTCVTGTTIIAGGDSVALARKHPRADKISNFSTGGGAALAYLTGKPLPGLDALRS